MRWSQGVWSEKRLIEAVNETKEFFAVPYGPSGTAPSEAVRRLWQALNHPETIRNLAFAGKLYGGGAVKVEPRQLDTLEIPESVLREVFLETPQVEKELFLFEKARIGKVKKS